VLGAAKLTRDLTDSNTAAAVPDFRKLRRPCFISRSFDLWLH
jgi:hypothetical protein